MNNNYDLLQNNDEVKYCGGKPPNHSMTTTHLEQGKKYNYELDSLGAMATASFAIAYNLVGIFEVKAYRIISVFCYNIFDSDQS